MGIIDDHFGRDRKLEKAILNGRGHSDLLNESSRSKKASDACRVAYRVCFVHLGGAAFSSPESDCEEGFFFLARRPEWENQLL